MLLILALAIPFEPVRWWALFSLSVVGAHVSTALIVGGAGIDELIALMLAPWYLAWKILQLPDILRSARRDTHWIRTERTGEG
jgi:hypothetical protein